MGDIEEDRVFDERAGRTEVFVATGSGLVVAETSNARVGRFRVTVTDDCRDVATEGTRVAVATDRDVLLREDDAFAETDFGAAVAVTFHDGTVVAAGKGGRVGRYVDGSWESVGTVSSVRALDGPLVAANTGVYRIGDGLDIAGLDDVTDVSATGIPLAATSEALYSLGNGWMNELAGDFRAVSSDGERAAAVGTDGVYARQEAGWHPLDVPTDETVVDVGFGSGMTILATDGGTLLLNHEGDWRSRALGLRNVSRLATR